LRGLVVRERNDARDAPLELGRIEARRLALVLEAGGERVRKLRREIVGFAG
jgi:hypothetical protein